MRSLPAPLSEEVVFSIRMYRGNDPVVAMLLDEIDRLQVLLDDVEVTALEFAQ